MRRKALALGVALALVLASIPALLVLNSYSKPSGAVEMSLPLPELTITVNGRTVYTGPDPPTSNMITLLSVVLGANIGGSSGVTIKDTGGASRVVTSPSCYGSSYCAKDSSGKNFYLQSFPQTLYIVLGNGSQSLSRGVYKLANQIASVRAGQDFGYNSTHVWLDLVGSYQFPSSNTITEVGVDAFSVGYDNLGNGFKYDTLLIYTTIPAVSVKQGDLVVVRYRFYFTKPFTMQMAKYMALVLPPNTYGEIVTQSINHTLGTAQFAITEDNPSWLKFNCYVFLGLLRTDARYRNPQVYLAYGSGTQPWSIWDRDVYSPLGRAPLETVTASDNAVQMVFYISNTGSTNMHITELALQLNTTDASGVWRLVTLARWTVDYTIQAGSGVHIAVRVATP